MTIRFPQAPPTIIGVLEQPPQCSETRNVGVRALFARRDNAWVPLNGVDSLYGIDLRTATFTLAFDGRSLGTVNTIDKGFTSTDDWFFRRDHQLDIVSGQSVPQIANESKRYEGWCNTPPVRPIAAVEFGHYQDPEHWKPFRPQSGAREKLLAQFRARVPEAYVCRNGKDVLYHYTAKDLTIQSAYQSETGRQLVALVMRAGISPCDDPGSSAQFINHWFILGETPRSIGDAMDLVDAGDYDGDGRSEVLFWTSGEDVDGYVLLYDDFTKHAEFKWSYH